MKEQNAQPARVRIRISGEYGRITRMSISGRSAPVQNKAPQAAQGAPATEPAATGRQAPHLAKQNCRTDNPRKKPSFGAVSCCERP